MNLILKSSTARSPVYFIASATSLSSWPPDTLPEIAFAGRSNVGKSSLINALVGKKKIAHTSKTPGKTRCINFFEFKSLFNLVDLPGYGYAKVSQKERTSWKKMVEEYLQKRKTLAGLVILADVRRLLQEEEWMLIDLCRKLHLEFVVALTKCDKPRSNERRKLIASIQTRYPDIITVPTSAISGRGINELLGKIVSMSQACRVKKV